MKKYRALTPDVRETVYQAEKKMEKPCETIKKYKPIFEEKNLLMDIRMDREFGWLEPDATWNDIFQKKYISYLQLSCRDSIDLKNDGTIPIWVEVYGK